MRACFVRTYLSASLVAASAVAAPAGEPTPLRDACWSPQALLVKSARRGRTSASWQATLRSVLQP
jgi:hypothetical protein